MKQYSRWTKKQLIKEIERLQPRPQKLYPDVIWVKEPHGPDYDTEDVFVEKRDISNCYARRGSHWIKYQIVDENPYINED